MVDLSQTRSTVVGSLLSLQKLRIVDSSAMFSSNFLIEAMSAPGVNSASLDLDLCRTE